MATNVPSVFLTNLNNAFALDNSLNIPVKSKAIIYSYHGQPQQVFYLENNGAGYLIRSKYDGKVLEVPPFSDGSDGTELQFANKSGNDRQRWIISNNGDNFGGVSLQAYNSKYAAVRNGTVQNENVVVLSTKQDKAASWNIKKV